MEDLLQYVWFVPVGLVAGALGTFVGAGGGFLVVPFLALWDPELGPETITAISLAVIFFNSTSGSLRYAKTRRIDYLSGLTFAAATIPGAAFGAYVSDMIPRATFNTMFGVFMVAVATFLLARPAGMKAARAQARPGHFRRSIRDAGGTVWEYAYNRWIGVTISSVVGVLSSLLGIGGGIIHVPVMTRLLNFPVHIATATSHFILAITSLTGVTVHVIQGEYSNARTLAMVGALAVGVIPGAQIGARLSERAKASWILRALGFVIILVAARLFVGAFLD